MAKHHLRFQVTIPASLTRKPEQVLKKTIAGAAEHLSSMVPRAKNKHFAPRYEERKTKLGVVLDLLVVMTFDHDGPLPPHVNMLKSHHEITTQLRRGRGN